jgi:predicted GNAT family acetyltransferase
MDTAWMSHTPGSNQMTVTRWQIDVRDNPHLSRYDVFVDDELAGFAVYHRVGGRVVFMHTQVADRYEKHGVGTALAGAALDDVRRSGLHVTPLCPFITSFIRHHPEYRDLIADDDRLS